MVTRRWRSLSDILPKNQQKAEHSIITITSTSGVALNVVRVDIGERYGLEGCIVNTQGEPLIEFYDSRFPFTPHGQFISRYHLSTLREHKATEGLDLYGSEPNWKINAAQLQIALEKVMNTNGTEH